MKTGLRLLNSLKLMVTGQQGSCFGALDPRTHSYDPDLQRSESTLASEAETLLLHDRLELHCRFAYSE